MSETTQGTWRPTDDPHEDTGDIRVPVQASGHGAGAAPPDPEPASGSSADDVTQPESAAGAEDGTTVDAPPAVPVVPVVSDVDDAPEGEVPSEVEADPEGSPPGPESRQMGAPAAPALAETDSTVEHEPATDPSTVTDDPSPQSGETTDPAREDLTWSPPSQQGPVDVAPEATSDTGRDAAGDDTQPETPQTDPAPEPDSFAAAAAAALETVQAQLAEVAAAVAPVAQLQTSLAELRRLRANDTDIIDRLHAENTRLRTGELAAAMAPLLQGLIRLHDNMTSIAGGDPNSVAGMLRTQLVQLLEVAAGVSIYEPARGERFDPARHTGAARVPTGDAAADGTIARLLRPGFVRGDGSILRVAEVEVLRYTAPASTDADQNQKEPQ